MGEAGAAPGLQDRRPIKAREKRVFHALAAALARRGVTPNAISVMSIVFSALGCAATVAAAMHGLDVLGRALLLVAAGCVQLRLIANLIDGLVAVEGGMRSAVGELYNEAPDRVSDAFTLVGFGFLTPHWWLGLAATIAAIFVAYVRALGKGAGARNHFVGPMAKQHRMAIVTVALVVLALLPTRFAAWEVSGVVADLPSVVLAVIIVGCVATSARRFRLIAGDMREAAATGRQQA